MCQRSRKQQQLVSFCSTDSIQAHSDQDVLFVACCSDCQFVVQTVFNPIMTRSVCLWLLVKKNTLTPDFMNIHLTNFVINTSEKLIYPLYCVVCSVQFSEHCHFCFSSKHLAPHNFIQLKVAMFLLN